MATLNVLAVGDSIVSQGNKDETKFAALVAAWLRTRGYGATLTMLAHSGAVASPTQNDASPAQWGEVPEPAPSILKEIELTPHAVDPAQADVVIVNGGINDVSPFHIVVANPFDPNGLANLAARTNQVFSGPVRQLVNETAQAFPNFLDLTAEHLPDEILVLAIDSERGRIIEQSKLFATLSCQLLQAAIAPYAATGRVFFADPGFGPKNAFAAPNTWLWSGSDDPLFGLRVARYTEHVVQSPFDWPLITPLASMCHPNVEGSKAYAAAVQACLQRAVL